MAHFISISQDADQSGIVELPRPLVFAISNILVELEKVPERAYTTVATNCVVQCFAQAVQFDTADPTLCVQLLRHTLRALLTSKSSLINDTSTAYRDYQSEEGLQQWVLAVMAGRLDALAIAGLCNMLRVKCCIKFEGALVELHTQDMLVALHIFCHIYKMMDYNCTGFQYAA
jgi:hypothetical protein